MPEYFPAAVNGGFKPCYAENALDPLPGKIADGILKAKERMEPAQVGWAVFPYTT